MAFSSSKRFENESRSVNALGRVGQEGGFRRSRQREMNRQMGYSWIFHHPNSKHPMVPMECGNSLLNHGFVSGVFNIRVKGL